MRGAVDGGASGCVARAGEDYGGEGCRRKWDLSGVGCGGGEGVGGGGGRTVEVFRGVCGWSPMQLEMEVGEGSWEVAGVGVEEVFETPEGVWEKLFKEASRVVPAVDPRRIPPDASVN